MEGMIWGKLVVEKEVVFDCVDEFFCSVPFSGEG
jgi:hypothetical protein